MRRTSLQDDHYAPYRESWTIESASLDLNPNTPTKETRITYNKYTTLSRRSFATANSETIYNER